MHILISNDDGYQAAGLRTLVTVLREIAQVTVVAPDRDRSGASNSLTLDAPIRATLVGPDEYAVNGTPTDCVHLALTGLLAQEPDLVVSGINAGNNMGDDVLYSGTVAAAMEGRFLGLPAIAVSLAYTDSILHYETAAQFTRRLVLRLQGAHSLTGDTILNINVPNLAESQLAGVEVTRLGNRHKSEPMLRTQDPRGRTVYWIGPPGEAEDAGAGTDFYAIKCGKISVTPLHTDLTQYTVIETLTDWIK